jgi:hypothetical protein
MPVLDTERQRTSRSALRYRSINTDQARPGPVVSRTHRSHPDARVTAPPVTRDDLDLEEEEYVPRRHSVPVQQKPAPRVRIGRRFHPLFFVSLGIIAMILLWTGITQAASWGSNELNTLKYGDPRTFQTDAVVGQGDSEAHPSHFIAVNLRGIVTIIEFPAGDPGRARVLASTNVLGSNADQAVAILRFVDINHNGKPDMLIDINGWESALVNDQGTFRPPTPAEQQQILQDIQQQH